MYRQSTRSTTVGAVGEACREEEKERISGCRQQHGNARFYRRGGYPFFTERRFTCMQINNNTDMRPNQNAKYEPKRELTNTAHHCGQTRKVCQRQRSPCPCANGTLILLNTSLSQSAWVIRPWCSPSTCTRQGRTAQNGSEMSSSAQRSTAEGVPPTLRRHLYCRPTARVQGARGRSSGKVMP